tara:strand:+ start:499 stop:744 length:246 start_codon:yes stop_codon:yes gene_type:complete
MTEVEFRLVHDAELPPIVITMNDDDKPKVVVNDYHKLWLALHRKIIGGCGEPLFTRVDEMLTIMLASQRADERQGREEVNE